MSNEHERFDRTVTTTCGYCGVGCRLEAHARGGRIASITPGARRSRQRGPHLPEGPLRAPVLALARPADVAADPRGRRASAWPAGTRRSHRIVSELTRIKDQHGPDAIAGLASSRATNEDCYAMQRLIRAAIGTNNIDNCSRVCHSPTSFALRKSFGLSGATGSFTDIDHADAAILIGANPTEGHPVVGARIKQAALRGLQAGDDRPAPDRARRLRRAAPLPAARHQRRGRCSGSGHVVAPRRPDRPGRSSTSGPRATRRSRSCSTPTRPQAVEEITGIPARRSRAAAHIYGEAGNASACCGAWA